MMKPTPCLSPPRPQVFPIVLSQVILCPQIASNDVSPLILMANVLGGIITPIISRKSTLQAVVHSHAQPCICFHL